ncbi:Uncharacterised protein [Mycobacteroides abscessus subsp. abscessus]|nr:Uncharacterised protein [Mycobacteroides abscessus subsp. abscessus]
MYRISSGVVTIVTVVVAVEVRTVMELGAAGSWISTTSASTALAGACGARTCTIVAPPACAVGAMPSKTMTVAAGNGPGVAAAGGAGGWPVPAKRGASESAYGSPTLTTIECHASGRSVCTTTCAPNAIARRITC